VSGVVEHASSRLLISRSALLAPTGRGLDVWACLGIPDLRIVEDVSHHLMPKG
jgi:hypothetical protein